MSAVIPPHGIAAEPFAAIVIGEATFGDDQAAQAVALAGGRLLARIGWDAVAAELGRHAGTPVLVVEAAGASEPQLLAGLPRVDAVAAALDLPLVAAFEADQIDIVAAGLLSARAQLLCAPTMAERVAALAIAAELRHGTTFHDSAREGEAVRLQRLNEEVARIADVLARLTRRDEAPAARGAREVFDRRPHFGVEPIAADQPIDPQEVRQAIRARRLRDQFLGAGLFEDPAWDMLLDLFAAELERVRVSVSSLCIAAAVAPTTALRWIGKLSDAGLLERQPDSFDRRRAYMALSERARTGMTAYVAAAKRAGLAIA